MKTLAEFIQRLQDDAVFEKQAQAFEQGEELMAFVKREGYNFTLEQLMHALDPEENFRAEAAALAPPPADLNPSPPPVPDETEFPRNPEALFSDAGGIAPPERAVADFTQKQPVEKLPPPPVAMPRPESEEEHRAGLFKGSGGRHRGFSPQRLKSIPEEDPPTGSDGF